MTHNKAADFLDELLSEGCTFEQIKAKVAEGIELAAKQIAERHVEVSEAVTNVFGLEHCLNFEICQRVGIRARELVSASYSAPASGG